MNKLYVQERARTLGVVLLLLVISSGLLPRVHAQASSWTQTTQADFAAGTLNGVNVSVSPGDVVLDYSDSVDQQQTSYTAGQHTSVYGVNYRAQTFRAGSNGPLTRIQLYVQRVGNPNALVVELRNQSGGRPGTTVYARAEVAAADIPTSSHDWVDFFFFDGYALSSGTRYALVVRQSGDGGSGGNHYGVATERSNAYASGTFSYTNTGEGGWITQAYDMTFRTYVGAYQTSGRLTSSVHDGGADLGSWGTLSWTDTTPVGTDVRFRIATSASSGGPWAYLGPDGTTNTYYTGSGAAIHAGHGSDRYIRYRAYLSGDGTATPLLHEVMIAYDAAVPTETPTPTNTPTGTIVPVDTPTHTPTATTVPPTSTPTPTPAPGDRAQYDNFLLCPLEVVEPPPPKKPPLLRECASVLSNADFEPRGDFAPWATGQEYVAVYPDGSHSADRDGRLNYGFSMRFRCDRTHSWPYSAFHPWAYQEFTVPAMISTTEQVTIEVDVSLYYGVPDPYRPELEDPIQGTLGRAEDELRVSLTEPDGTSLTTSPVVVAQGNLSPREVFRAFATDLAPLFPSGDSLLDYIDQPLRLLVDAPNVDGNDPDPYEDGDSEFYIDQVRMEICTTIKPPAYEEDQVKRLGGFLQVLLYGFPTTMQGVQVWAVQLPDGPEPPDGWGFYTTSSIHDSTYNFFNVNPGTYTIYAEVFVPDSGLYSTSTTVTVVAEEVTLDVNLLLD